MTAPLVVAAFAIAGALFGFAADRLSVRWPAHEDAYRSFHAGPMIGALPA